VPGFLRAFLSWWGLLILGALDATLAFVAPFGVDAAVIYLAAREETLFWLIPLTATAGSVAGASLTYWIGRRVGEPGLERLVRKQTLDRVRDKVEKGGAYAIAIPALLPPPFPLKPFILTCGALSVDPARFLLTLAVARGLRFSIETALARRYGTWLLTVLESDTFQWIVGGLIVLALAGTVVSAVVIWKKLKREQA
jgi:membrane protein YqaA with SNARE-associated domain